MVASEREDAHHPLPDQPSRDRSVTMGGLRSGGRTMKPRRGAMPEATVSRLARYLRQLEELATSGIEMVTSNRLAELVGVSPAVIRSDLFYLKLKAGKRGVGYSITGLVSRIRTVLGTDREQPVVLVGAGNVGRAIAN